MSPETILPPSRDARFTARPGRRPGSHAKTVCALGALAAAVFCCGCTPAQYARQADQAAHRVIDQKQTFALGQPAPFDIEYDPLASGGEAALLLDGQPIPLGQAPPAVLSLEQCLRIAFRNSRPFQTRKEELYVKALALANLRHDWSLVDGKQTAEADWSTVNDTGDIEHDGEVGLGISFAQRFVDGGVLTLAAALNAVTDFFGAESTTFGSLLSANFTQPLLRGAWRGFAYETLYRAERDMAFAILEYERFTQGFAVDVASDYYEVLQRLDELENETENLKRLKQTLKFIQAQVKGGMLSRVEADQAEQDVLSAQARIERTRQRYRDALDRYKLTLGLPIAASIGLDPAELRRLQPRPIPFPEGVAISVALRTRPDVLTEQAKIRDAARDVQIAADQFYPALDLTLGLTVPSDEPHAFWDSRFDRHTRSAKVTFDYQLDQTDNRDEYRLAQIAHSKARRDFVGFLDRVRLEVRQAFRALQQSRRTYEIQKAAVSLAIRRTRLVTQEQKEGLASTRDVLEAEDALRGAKNGLTAALVSYTTTRLEFLTTLGMIRVDEQGRFHERSQPQYFDRPAPAARR
jgi:outer membrane protein TolC